MTLEFGGLSGGMYSPSYQRFNFVVTEVQRGRTAGLAGGGVSILIARLSERCPQSLWRMREADYQGVLMREAKSQDSPRGAGQCCPGNLFGQAFLFHLTAHEEKRLRKASVWTGRLVSSSLPPFTFELPKSAAGTLAAQLPQELQT